MGEQSNVNNIQSSWPIDIINLLSTGHSWFYSSSWRTLVSVGQNKSFSQFQYTADAVAIDDTDAAADTTGAVHL